MVTSTADSDRLNEQQPDSSTESLPVIAARQRRRFPVSWILGAAVIAIAIGAAAVWVRGWSAERDSGELVTTEVSRTTFTITVLEPGTLESAANVNHFCEVEGRSGGREGGTTILWVIPEGSEVGKGELIVELDTAYLREMIQAQEIAIRDIESNLARINAEVVAAQKAIQEYEHGTFISQERLLRADIKLSEEKLKRAQQYLAYSERLHARGFITPLQLEADRFAVERLQLERDKVTRDLEILRTMTKEKELAYLHGDLASKLATQDSESAKVKQEQTRLDKYRAQLEKCKIYAKADGMVVYYEPPGRWGPDEDEKVRAGAVVRERKNLIVIPDLSAMRLRMMVHESKIDLVRQGQKAKIRVDAFPHQSLVGRVEMVGTTPAPGPWYDRDKRNYPVLVSIENPIEGLKPGMTAQGEIIVDELKQVIAVPIQCVYTAGVSAFCDVLDDSGHVETRQIQLGATNEVLVEVRSGLEPGERVIQSANPIVPEQDNGAPDQRDSPVEIQAEQERGPPPHARRETGEDGLP